MPKAFIIVCVSLLVAALLAPSYAAWTAPGPAIIASVDLERAFNKTGRRVKAEERLEQLAEVYRVEIERLRSAAEQSKMDMEMLVPGTPKYKEAESAWKQAVLDYRAMVEFSKGKLDAKRAEARKNIYQQIIDAAAGFAEANGIDFIVADDSVIDLQQGTDLQIVQQMSLRRVVYANEAFDVTDELITWLNEH